MTSLKKNLDSGTSMAPAFRVPYTGMVFAAKVSVGEPIRDGIGGSLAFAGLYLFSFLLYIRPNELFPNLLGGFPIARIVAIAASAIYIGSRLNQNKPLTIWPPELSMIGLIALLGVLFMPLAAEPEDTVNVLLDHFFKIVVIFILMINLVDGHRRLRASLQLLISGGTVLGILVIKSFLLGELYSGRVQGPVGGTFSNPNDMASWLDMLFPLALVLALTKKGFVRLSYLAVATVMLIAVFLTFSRGGFLGAIAMGGVCVWKLRRRLRRLPAVAAILFGGGLILFMPTSYGSRLSTIFTPGAEASAQERRALLERGLFLASRHSMVGIGMGNFHLYSIHEKRAHNAYVEIWAELGVAGLFAYLTLIFVSLRKLWRLELKVKGEEDEVSKNIHYLSVGLQSALAAYLVCSFFGSIQYEWFLYCPLAYAVSLKTIYDRKDMSLTSNSREVETLFGRPDGLLWRPQQQTSRAAHIALRGSVWTERPSYGR